MVSAMKVSFDDETMRVTVVLAPVFRPGVLSSAIRQQLPELFSELVIDTRWIKIMHSPMLGELVQLYCHLQKRGVTMHLVNVSAANARLFGYTRLNELLNIHDGER
jgi:anti-anti-sigma factor